MKLDRTDIRILNVLQQDGRISNLDLAEKVDLSPSPCSRRVKHLEDIGIINRSVTLLDSKALGLNLLALVQINLDKHTPETFEAFEQEIATYPEVLECCLITGQTADYQVKVVVPDMERYQEFLMGRLTRMKGVTAVHSSFVMRKVVYRTELPLTHIA